MNPIEMAARTQPMTSAAASKTDTYITPAAGRAMLRFVGYIELGTQKYQFKNVDTYRPRVRLEFELVGSRHPPVNVRGQLYSQRITFEESLSDDYRSNLRKLFLKMRGGRENIVHMAEMLGEAFIGVVTVSEFVRKDGSKGGYAKLRTGKSEYNIQMPLITHEDGTTEEIEVPTGRVTPRAFIWDFPTIENWNVLFAGNRPDSIQSQILKAQNYKGSPLDRLLQSKPVERIPAVRPSPVRVS